MLNVGREDAHALVCNHPPVQRFTELLAPLKRLSNETCGPMLAGKFSVGLHLTQHFAEVSNEDFLSVFCDALELTIRAQYASAAICADVAARFDDVPATITQGSGLVQAHQEALVDVGQRLNITRLVVDEWENCYNWEESRAVWKLFPGTANLDISKATLDTFPRALQAFMCEQACSIFNLSTSPALQIYSRVAGFMAGDLSIEAKQVMRSTYEDFPVYMRAREVNNKFFFAQDCGDHGDYNPHRQLNRLLHLAALAVANLVAAEFMRAACPKLSEPVLLGPRPDIPQVSTNLSLDCSLLTSRAVGPIMGHFITRTGVTPSSLSTLLPARDANRFLSDQVKAVNSTYAMPKLDASQRTWNLWFKQILQLPKIYDLEPKTAIPTLLTGVSQDDDRIFGWFDACSTKPDSFQTIENFVAHVQTVVLGRATSRADAKDALLALSRTYKELGNCRALHVRIAQLLEQLFPLQESVELEPITYSQAVQVVHQLLADLKKAHPVKGDLLNAWRAETQFNKSLLFNQYLLESLHRAAGLEGSKTLLDEYLANAYRLLEDAHAEYSQLKALPVIASAELSKHQVLSLCATALNVTPKFLTQAAKGDRIAGSTTQGANSKKRPNVAAATAGKNGQSSGRNNKKPSTNFEHVAKLCDKIKAHDSKVSSGTLRTRLPKLGQETAPVSSRVMLAHVPYADARKRIVDGACPICLEKAYDEDSKTTPPAVSSENHVFGECLKRRGIVGTPSQKHYMKSVINPWLTAWKAVKAADDK